jgi:hypothetical protein
VKEQRITIEIDEAGKITADADGFSGDACLRDIDKLLEGIAAAREETTRKPDEGDARAKARAGKTVTVGKKS